ncbi:type II toxin-antitoxin system VapB family antitoxin [Aureimonas psammosilenae]|uniref:type II toxin-antitoxin system VapB family antitoxin n=1 Tax=Aureimonas psammosilenae TaxID=2495496 RepID=UPI0012609ED4|nr:type II toxin-antitoxin system VapB family antitoxin [Aureimonas psammosilenae]
MALHIRDDRTDKLVRELANRKGVGLTEAVREAVENELLREQRKIPLRERLKPLLDELDAVPRTGLVADKAFYDSLYDDED